MSIPAGIDPSDFLDWHYCEMCRKVGHFENDMCGECNALWSEDDDPTEEEFVCNHCGKIREGYKDEGGICRQCIKRDQPNEEG